VNIYWSEDLIDSFIEKIIWQYFTFNPKAFLNFSLLEKYDKRIDWLGEEFVYGDSITANSGLPWDMVFIEMFEKKIDFEKLSYSESVKWSEKIIDKYYGKWDMTELACNKSIPWSLSLFDKYLDVSYFKYYPVKWNTALISKIDFIEKYQNYLDWHNIFANEQLPWFELDLMNKWYSKIDWWGIASNELFFKNDKNFFYKNIDKWLNHERKYINNFDPLSSNMFLPWSISFIEEYKNSWNWEYLSANKGLPWSFALIDYFNERFIWGGLVPGALFDEEGNEIASTGGYSFQDGLIFNSALPWSIDFLNYYDKQLDFKVLELNSSVWEKAFKPYVNDEIIETVLRII